jgi:hypothetical protein
MIDFLRTQGGPMLKSLHFIRRNSMLVALSGLLTLGAGATIAKASSGIEGVWSFNGGAVDVIKQPNGTFSGFVTKPIKFAKCEHPLEEQMWIEMRAQPDGSYWGEHHWYFENCEPNPTYGPTVWRVLQNPSGGSFLRVCFSSPGSNLQPTIAPDGTSANVNHPPCIDSQLIAPLSNGAKEKPLTLPSGKVCVRQHTLKISLTNPKYDPLKQVVVWVNGKKVLTVHGAPKLKHSIRLTHLPNGGYTVKVVATTLLDHRLTGSRKYKSCKGGAKHITLHRRKGSHGKSKHH